MTLPEQARAAETLTPQMQTQILNMLAARAPNAGRCIPAQRMGALLEAHPAAAREIVAFASRNLGSRKDLLGNDCACPQELAVASINVVPDQAGPLRRVLEDRYPECDLAVKTAMEQSLGGIAPGAGAGAGDRGLGATLSRSGPNGEGGLVQNAARNGDAPARLGGLSGQDSMRKAGAGSALPPDLQAEILEALEASPERENQCIAANAFGALIKANPELALAIMDFADFKLSSKGRLLGDECVCPIELATATVSAVPDLSIPVRRALDDRYPECTEPAADGRNGSRSLPPEPPCFETASPSC